MTTSSDGYLTATADLASASILLSTNFSAIVPPPAVNLAAFPRTGSSTARLAPVTNCVVVVGSEPTGPSGYGSRVVTTASGNAVARQVERIAVTPGDRYTATVKARAATTTVRAIRCSIAWYTAAGAYISTTAGVSSNDNATAMTTFACLNAQAPATAYFAAIEVLTTGGAAAEQHGFDGFQIVRGATDPGYVDGYQTGSAWAGTPEASMSYRPGYHKVTIYRIGLGPVRGADNAVAPNGVGTKFIDHEAPLGVAAVYQAAVSNGISAIISTTATATITGQAQATWLKSLRTPSTSMPVYVETWPDWERAIDLAAMPRLSSRYPSVATGLRQASVGTLVVLTLDTVDRAKLTALLEADGPYLLQGSVASGEPDRYVMIDKASINRINRLAAETYRRFELPLIEVARPSTPGSRVAVPGHTYADSRVAWPLYSNRTGAYGTR